MFWGFIWLLVPRRAVLLIPVILAIKGMSSERKVGGVVALLLPWAFPTSFFHYTLKATFLTTTTNKMFWFAYKHSVMQLFSTINPNVQNGYLDNLKKGSL